MLGFFLDAQLTRPVSPSSPKRFVSPVGGIVKSSTVYLGDPYSAIVLASAAPGAASLSLNDTSEFLSPGSALIGDQLVSYTGISGLVLTGVTGVVTSIAANSEIVPNKKWSGRSQVSVMPTGTDAGVLNISIQAEGGGFTFPGMPLILSWSELLLNKLEAALGIPLDVQIRTSLGAQEELTDWGLMVSPLYPISAGTSAIADDAGGTAAYMYGYVNRQDQMLPQYIRLLPANRDVSAAPDGFTIGEYSWRGDTEINAQAIVPTNWNTIPSSVGSEKFIAGIGCREDLEPLGFVQHGNSVYLNIHRGFYYTGPNGYYLPARPQLDVLNAMGTRLSLSASVQPIKPLFVGTYSLDSQGFYEKSIEYRYKTAQAVSNGTNLPPYYYTLDRTTNTVILNKPLPVFPVYLGVISGNPTDYFDLPIYPIDGIDSVYVRRVDGSKVVGINWTLDQEGTVTISNPAGTGTSIAGSIVSEMVMADCVPAVAVLYETADVESLALDSLDLNPAFSGVSGGVVYLQHSKQKVASLVLSCDKPIIDIPATYSSIIGLIAYGPVYFNGDYSLLQVTAYSKVPGQIVQGAKLEVVIDDPYFLGTPFTGTLNGIDPTLEAVKLTTGADGSANLVFRPQKDYGFYIPPTAASGGLAGLATTTVTNDTIVLPEPISISQIRPPAEGDWLAILYTVYNDNPLYGKVGADTGEIPWSATTTPNGPGTVGYRTNGQILPLMYPSQALDSAGRNYDNVLFDGNVVELVFSQTLSTAGNIGAYFLTFTQRILLRVQALNSNVKSNSILLQMAPALPINDNPWLILNDAINGILNQYRLGLDRWETTPTTPPGTPPPTGGGSGGFGVGGFGVSPFGT